MRLILKCMGLAALVVLSIHGSLFSIALTVRHMGGGKAEYFLAVSSLLFFAAASLGFYAFFKARKP